MGLFNSDKAKDEARQDPSKALGMLRKMVGKKRMTSEVMEMIVGNLPKNENPQAEKITEKVGWYGVEHGYTYNHWLNLITIGSLDPQVSEEAIEEMPCEELIEMLERNMEASLNEHPDIREKMKSRGWI